MPTITQLPALVQASVVPGTDVLAIVNGGATKKVTAQAIVNSAAAALAPQGGTLALTGAMTVSTTLTVTSTSTLNGVATINLNAAALPSALAGTALHIGQTNGTASRMLVDSFAANGAISFRRANGTAAAPTNLTADQAIGAFFGFGYGATGYSASGRAGFTMFAAESWTDSAQGAYMEFSSTPTGATSSVARLRIQAAGEVCTQTKLCPGTDAGAFQVACGLFAGTGAPSNANGANGDFYFRSDGGALTSVYQRRAGAWVGIV